MVLLSPCPLPAPGASGSAALAATNMFDSFESGLPGDPAQVQRAQRRACVSAGIDKENVELSPTAGHANSGRMRHGSASQVQKQRSAGSFKRHSIKKIV